MIDIRLDCEKTFHVLGIVPNPIDVNGIVVYVDSSALSSVYVSEKDTRRLYEALGAHLGNPPAEPAALTRIAVASERAADALEKLASYATEDGLTESARIP